MRASYRRLWPDPGGAGSGQYRPEGAVMTCSVTSSVPKFPETRCLCIFLGLQTQGRSRASGLRGARCALGLSPEWRVRII